MTLKSVAVEKIFGLYAAVYPGGFSVSLTILRDVYKRQAKNYAAKAFGVSTGEAIWQAKQKCQDLVIVEPHLSLIHI